MLALDSEYSFNGLSINGLGLDVGPGLSHKKLSGSEILFPLPKKIDFVQL